MAVEPMDDGGFMFVLPDGTSFSTTDVEKVYWEGSEGAEGRSVAQADKLEVGLRDGTGITIDLTDPRLDDDTLEMLHLMAEPT